jgi:hypothetical protein
MSVFHSTRLAGVRLLDISRGLACAVTARKTTRRFNRAVSLTALAVCATAVTVPAASAYSTSYSYPSTAVLGHYYPKATYGWCYHTPAYADSLMSAGVHMSTEAVTVNWCSNGRRITYRSLDVYEKSVIPLEFRGWSSSTPHEMWTTDQYGGSVDQVTDDAGWCVFAGVEGIGGCVPGRSYEIPLDVSFSGTLFNASSGALPVAAYHDASGWHWVGSYGWKG